MSLREQRLKFKPLSTFPSFHSKISDEACRQNMTFLINPYRRANTNISDGDNSPCCPSSRDRCTVGHSDISRRLRYNPRHILHSIGKLPSGLTLHVLCPVPRLYESPLLSPRHLSHVADDNWTLPKWLFPHNIL